MKYSFFVLFCGLVFGLSAADSLESGKFYVNDVIDVYSGQSYLVERNIHPGAWFTDDCSVGRHPYYNFEPVFDSDGNWLDDVEVDSGDYRELKIVAGPFDSYEAALRFCDRSGITNERSSGSGAGGPGVTLTQYGNGQVTITTGSGSVDLQPGSELTVVSNGDGSRTYYGTDSNGNDFTVTVNSDGSSHDGSSSSSSLPNGVSSFIVPSGSGSGSGSGEGGSGSGSGSGSGEGGSGSGSGSGEGGSGSGSGWTFSNSPPGDNPMLIYEYSQGGTTISGYKDGSFTFSTDDRSIDLQPGSEFSTTNYSDGSRVVSGTDSEGKSFTVTVLPDGSVRDGGMPEGDALAELGISVTSSGSVTVPDSNNPYSGEPDLGEVISGGSSGGSSSDYGNMCESWPNGSVSGSGGGQGTGGGGSGSGDGGSGSGDGGSGSGDGDGEGSGGGVSGYSPTHMPYKTGFDPSSRTFSSSALSELKRKLVPNLSSFSGGGDSDFVFHVPLQFLSYDFSFDVGPMRTACGGALLPLMSFSRSVSIFLFAFIFIYGIVRALRQW